MLRDWTGLDSISSRCTRLWARSQASSSSGRFPRSQRANESTLIKQLSGLRAREGRQIGRVAQVSSIRQQRRALLDLAQHGAAAESGPSRPVEVDWSPRGGHDPRHGQH